MLGAMEREHGMQVRKLSSSREGFCKQGFGGDRGVSYLRQLWVEGYRAGHSVKSQPLKMLSLWL